MLLDGDGTFRHWKFPGSYSEQPAFDIHVYQIIKAKYVELVNEKIEQETGRIKK
jgi:hypothetical protein